MLSRLNAQRIRGSAYRSTAGEYPKRVSQLYVNPSVGV